MNLPEILLWGAVATVVLTTIMAMSQGLGLSRMSLPYLVGMMFTSNRELGRVLGIGVHLVNGLWIALIYGLIFHSIGRATWYLGLGLGLVHGLFILAAVIPALPGIHPRMASDRHGPTPTRQLQPPGFMGLNYGRRTPITELTAHLAYGLILGTFYTVG